MPASTIKVGTGLEVAMIVGLDSNILIYLVGADAATIHIADCFFLVTDTHGTIVASSPKIVKRY